MNHRLLLFGILLCGALCMRELILLPDGKLHLHVLDVGQGDASLLITPSGKQIVVDGGPDLSLLEHVGRRMPFFDRTIELVILTHPDTDHITALPALAERYTIGAVLLGGEEHVSGRYEALLASLSEQGTTVLLPDVHRDIDLGDGVVIDVVWPTPDVQLATMSTNDASIVTRVLYDDHAILLTGDIEELSESMILATGVDIAADIVKVPHHGSRTSSSTGFILAVHPDLAIISAGRENRFGHPHPEILDRYSARGIQTKTTSDLGVVSLEL